LIGTALALPLVVSACDTLADFHYQYPIGFTVGSSAPTGPPTGTQLCNGGPDATTLLSSPYPAVPTPATVHAAFPNIPNAAANVVDLPAGNNAARIGANSLLAPNTFYYFEPGGHTLGTSPLASIGTLNASGSVFYGGGSAANPAILDGQSINQDAFTDRGKNVAIKYLTIRNFVAAQRIRRQP
jgi:hypothetical protein